MRKLMLFIITVTLLILGGCAKNQPTNKQTTKHTTEEITTTTQTTTNTNVGEKNDPYLVIHYNRTDNNYNNWNLWIWQSNPINKEGGQFNFTEHDSFGRVARIKLNEGHLNGATRIGFIIRYKEWEQKDIETDRFIDVTRRNENNEIHVWIIQGEPLVYYNENNVYVGPRITQMNLSSSNTIYIKTNKPITEEDTFDVQAGFLKLGVEKLMLDADKEGVTIVLKEDFDFTKKDYKIVINKQSIYEMDMVDIYNSNQFNEMFHYTGNDLGVTYSATKSIFKVWAPFASDLSLNIYEGGDNAKYSTDLIQSYSMTKHEKGTWILEIPQDLHGKYYTYSVTNFGSKNEVVDPYARSVGVNGRRGMILDLTKTNPENWNPTSKPAFNNPEDAIIYELHVRDLSIDVNSGIQNKGKFLGLTERGTSYQGVSTGLDHLIDLGITHLHLLPAFDYKSVNEKELNKAQFNWGYDPLNYNAPEGSYSTNPYLGDVRVNEFKQMVQTLHDNGIRVIMDVVYNHTGPSQDSDLNRLVPNYYYRTENGVFTNGSGCGNETASERAMVRKLIIDSVVYWAKEYNISGFRFDLMGLHDIETMNLIREAVNEIDPSIILYGEGWTAGGSPLPSNQQALKNNVSQMPGIAVFSDDIRNGIKGNNDDSSQGFIQNGYRTHDVKFGIVGSTYHNGASNDSNRFWATDPQQTINYASAHDNMTLWDKIEHSSNASLEQKKLMHKQANAIVLTSQGIPFLHAGSDFARTKYGNHNSYNASDYVNKLDWARKVEFIDVYNYYKGLIALRKAHPAFRMTTRAEIQTNLQFFNTGHQSVIGYTLNNNANGDSWNKILVIFNGSEHGKEVLLPQNATWNIVVDEQNAGTTVLRTHTGNSMYVKGHGTIVAYLD